MRLVLDTNIVLSGLIWHGTPARLFRLASEGRIKLITSERLLAELQTVVARKKFTSVLLRRNRSQADILFGYALLCEIVAPQPIPPTVLRDPDDDAVLAAALAERADLIVTGDLDLLDIGTFRTIPILTAAQAVTMIERQEAK